WNIARNRYRGSPLPIWQNVDDENDHFTMGSLEEIYQFSRSGSKNLTKFMLIRHGRTNFNLEKRQDCRGDLALLNDLGKEQAEQVKEQLKAVKSEPEKVIILSPMERTRETAFPTLKDRYTEEEIKEIRQHYDAFQAKWREIRDKGESIAYLHNEKNETLFDLSHGVWGDFLASEFQQNSKHNQISPCELHLTVPTSQPLVEGDECVDQVFERTQRCIRNLAEEFRTQTIIIFSHGDPILGMRSAFSPFEYLKEKNKYYPKNGKILTHYYDHDKQAEIDLHKPYVDSYWGMKEGKTYKRIPEVMDCWFESGAMPFGQSHYLKGQEHENGTFTADFIAEGLDQTRGRFRSLHVVGHAIEGNNAAKNIIVNGLVLAEDGKKMSKKLKNYPDPQYLLEKRGGDAFRMYVLSSPAVRAEPLRFSEKGVEQTFKDFNLPLQNVYNFFETYAKIDHWKDTGTKVFFADAQLTKEQIVRINPDIVLYEKEEKKNQISPLLEACNIQVSAFDHISEEDEQQYFELLKKYHGKRILLL
ncbi:MAG: class I tRNA ligase family protein, partial [Patescibacteria group bacterium]|nr:class I tRNA ligase family protein [Patescibacteria group bacterium]